MRARRRLGYVVATILVIVPLVACQAPPATPSPALPTTAPTTAAPPTTGASLEPGATASAGAAITLIAAGDIARCDLDGDEQTAALVKGLSGTVLTLGDSAYDRGSPKEFAECYDPSWGQFLERTWAVPGNHEHDTPDAAGYFGYYGDRAGPAGRGWYALRLGDWHVITLDSECRPAGGCEAGSEQVEWLVAELADRPSACTIVAFHKPRFSSGERGDERSVEPLWRLAVAAGVDVILNGHEHSYERLGPMDADGRPDAAGVTVFIVGTGGAPLRGFPSIEPASQVRIDDHHGVLELQLGDGSFDWAFRSAPDGSVRDEGSGACR